MDLKTHLDALEDEVATLAAHVHAATYRLLVCLRELDESGRFGSQGFRSCAHWLAWRTGLDLGAAREKVRVARALPALPKVAAELSRGRISYAKVRALTRIATPHTEDELLNVALHGTASHVERLVRSYRKVRRLEENTAEERRAASRWLDYYHDEDGMLVIHGRLPPVEGALVARALGVAEQEVYRDTVNDPGAQPDATQRRADALVRLAEAKLGGAEAVNADRYQVVVHVAAETLADPDAPGRSELEDGPGVAAETSRRLACDGSVVVMQQDAQGKALDLGRKRRVVNAAMRRALAVRDGGCRFPGCTNRRVDHHHVEHWANGGATSLGNLVQLCAMHHRLVHEGGFTVRWSGDELEVLRPDGVVLPKAPPQAPEASAAALQERQRHLGIGVDTMTLWNGEQMDYPFALEGLLRRGDERPAT